ncbi:hypothetical protein J4Q44_G00187240 [Coregonus suidteri]|uniref:Uncharacterized protein n=1 Tax=Coregonus suidteri TaxID=861788 RepID=A0AAN8QNE7_9TELE
MDGWIERGGLGNCKGRNVERERIEVLLLSFPCDSVISGAFANLPLKSFGCEDKRISRTFKGIVYNKTVT